MHKKSTILKNIMSEQLGCEIDNSEILPTQEDLGYKILKENILTNILTGSI